MENENDIKIMEREINEEESEVKVSQEHKIYIISNFSNLSGYKIIKSPSKFLSFVSLSNLEKAAISDSGLSCGILNQTTENIFSLGNFEESVKCLSFDTSTLFSNFESSANLPLESPFGLNMTSKPLCFRNNTP